MILAIGEILFDDFPEGKHIGGAPFNCASHLKAMGFPVTFVSRVGTDADGDAILETLERRGFDVTFLQRDPRHATGRVTVDLDENGVPEFIIHPDAAYDHLAVTGAVKKALSLKPELILFGTLVQRTETAAATVLKILENRPSSTRCLCDLNLRKGCYNEGSILTSLTHSDILKLSDGELATLKALFNADTGDEPFVRRLMDAYRIHWVSLTSGASGSSLFTPDGVYRAAVDARQTVVDTVGAGDAYAAMVAAGFLRGWDPDRILKRATRFSGAICGIEGAVPAGDDFYRPFVHWTTNQGGVG